MVRDMPFRAKRVERRGSVLVSPNAGLEKTSKTEATPSREDRFSEKLGAVNRNTS